jgi:uncharacterized protein (DUF934 family)
MPLIKNGCVVDNEWTFIDNSTDPDGTGLVTVSLPRYLQDVTHERTRNVTLGVRLTPSDDPDLLLPHLDHLPLIEIEFPKYTDGRGYSLAQILRRRHGYTGELRAVGHVLRDQILYMNRSGFDAFETARADLSQVLEALSEHSAYYQPAADGHPTVFARRHLRPD